MSLNIKSDEIRRMASELADLTGETMTGAPTAALRERLKSKRRARGADLARMDIRAVLPANGDADA